MLKSLFIRNYAIISELSINFEAGLTTITGETGAGKSILLGAMGLILGNRADTSVLKKNDENCIVEARFDIQAYRLKPLFETYDVDYEAKTTIRRVINPSGKSRAFVNDLPVNLNFLKALSAYLVDVHSQHSNLLLNDKSFQLGLIDSFAQNHNLLKDYQQHYSDYRQTENAYHELAKKAAQEKADQDYYAYQLEQLEEAALKEGEQEEIEEELEKLTHAEEIKTNLATIYNSLNGEQENVLTFLQQSLDAADQLKKYFQKAGEIYERLNSASIDLEDLTNEVDVLNNDVEYDPQRIEQLNERLNLLYSLQKKHNCTTIGELMALHDSLKNRLEQIESYDDELEQLQQDLEKKRQELNARAKKLSERRKEGIPKVEKAVTGILKKLGMPASRFQVKQERLEDFNNYGVDRIHFLFTANPDLELQPVSKVASGGEMSRIMLALKSLLAKSMALPTIIFDEIDAGVSGDVANRMGEIMRQMAGNLQVINITHLPQVAAQGEHHYIVYKSESDSQTHTDIKKLEQEARIQEIAKMLSGSDVTEAALDNARVLLQESQEK